MPREPVPVFRKALGHPRAPRVDFGLVSTTVSIVVSLATASQRY